MVSLPCASLGSCIVRGVGARVDSLLPVSNRLPTPPSDGADDAVLSCSDVVLFDNSISFLRITRTPYGRAASVQRLLAPAAQFALLTRRR